MKTAYQQLQPLVTELRMSPRMHIPVEIALLVEILDCRLHENDKQIVIDNIAKRIEEEANSREFTDDQTSRLSEKSS